MTSAAKGRPEGAAARQLHLLAAAVDVVGTSGLRGLTHRAVDRRAELPEGSCSVYYRTRLALLTALAEYVADKLTSDVVRLSGRLPDHEDTDAAIRETIGLLLRWSADPAMLMTSTELTLESVRTPSLQPIMESWRGQLVAVVEGIVCRSGRSDAFRRAEAVVASLEGLALSALRQTRSGRETFLSQNVPVVIRALAGAEQVSAT